MDNLLYFFLASLFSFILPLVLMMAMARSKSFFNFMHNNVLWIYDTKNGGIYFFELICMLIGMIILVFLIIRRLKKPHIYSFEINEVLTIGSISLLQKVKEIKVPFNQICIEYKPETEEEDIRYDLFLAGAKRPIFSTSTNKYWDIKTDNDKLKQIFLELIKKGCKFKFTNKENFTAYEATRYFANHR